MILVFCLLSTFGFAKDAPKPTLADVDIEHPDALKAYQAGCAAKQFYACYRLGQYHEVKSFNNTEALKAYNKSCRGKDQDGCEGEFKLRSNLCYVEKKKSFCKGEPRGEYRALIFLETLSPKYKDAFVQHDFLKGFTIDAAEVLYDKRVSEKSQPLLEALRLSQKQGKHDGADAESLQIDIWKLEGNTQMLEGTGE